MPKIDYGSNQGREYDEFAEINHTERRKYMWIVLIADIIAIVGIALWVHAWATA